MVNPEQERKEREKLEQLKNLKKMQAEKKSEPAPVSQPEAKPQPAKPAPTTEFEKKSKEIISKIRKPEVVEVSAFDDDIVDAGTLPGAQKDPYEGKSMAEVLRMKRE